MVKRHYTYAERLSIETMLTEGFTIKEIEKDIKRPSCNIIKEINKHLTHVFPSSFNNNKQCLNYDLCQAKGFECFKTCQNVKYRVCPRLIKSPHVCNGCTNKSGCRYVKVYYNAREAHDNYKYTLSECRGGLHYNEYAYNILIERLCPLIIKTKSVFHAITTINNELGTSFNIKTVYRQIKNNNLPIKRSDLPRCRRNKSEPRDTSYKRNIEGHSYDDYLLFKKENPDAIETQMDTVEGIKENDAPVILTLEIVNINFLFMFKINSQTKLEVSKKLIYFKEIIGEDALNKILEILLTDNGKEFYITEEIKTISPNIHLFYCHPYASYEKGSIENNHELIRRVIPKGVSLKPYTQKEFNLLCSHINSLYRESLKGKCPFDLIENYLSLETIKTLGLTKIKPLDISLIPELLGEKNINNIKRYLDEKDIKKSNITFINKDE